MRLNLIFSLLWSLQTSCRYLIFEQNRTV